MKSKKMWLMALMSLIFLFIIPFAKSWEFDNTKSYDAETKTITITNALGLGTDLMKIKLIENTEYCSNDCYSIMEIDNYEEIKLSDKYDGTFGWDFENLKTSELEDISHNFKIAYSKSQIEEQVGEDCKLIDIATNLTECSKIFQAKEIYNWEDYKFENNVLPIGKYWLKLEGQKSYKKIIDWQPTLIGVNLKDVWAKWGDVNALGNFTFDGTDLGEDTGTGYGNFTDTNFTQLTEGCVDGNCTNLTTISSGIGDYLTPTTAGAWCFWFKPNINSTLETNSDLFECNSAGYDLGDFHISLGGYNGCSNTGGIVFYMQGTDGDGSGYIITPMSFEPNIWKHFCAKVNATGMYEFVDGVVVNSSTSGFGVGKQFYNADGTDRHVFTRGDIYAVHWIYDEAKFFNVEISSEQILDMYNTELLPSDIHITNCTDLQNMQDNLTANYVLDNNINCSDTINWNSGEGFIPIGNSISILDFNVTFNGSLNGQGYNITDLYINKTGYFAGLFGVCSNCSIFNLSLINETIIGSDSEIGGLIGWIKSGKIENSFTSGNIKGSSDVGGIIGFIENGIIKNSYSTANIEGSFSAGGLVGYFENGIINNSYSVGNIIGAIYIGGLVGSNEGGTCINSYWNEYLSEQSSSACGTELTNEEMLNQTFYVDWDFDNIWDIQANSTPYLRVNPMPFFPEFPLLDTTAPYFTDGTPQNQELAYNTALDYDINATDETAFDCFAVNDTRFKIDCSGLLQNNSLLGVDIYYLNITINDTSNNLNSTIMYVNVTKASRTCILETDKTWTREYDGDYSTTTCNVSEGNDDGIMNFTKNLIAVSSPDFQTNAGEFNYSCEWLGGQNYSDCQIFTSCYQETANVSTECGGLDIGSYAIIGNSSLFTDILNAYDGDYDTSLQCEYCVPNTDYVEVIYQKPIKATNNSKWQVKDGSIFSNLSIPSTCWNYNSTSLIFEVFMSQYEEIVSYRCYDGSWQEITQNSGGGTQIFYEEAMIWEIENPLTNILTINKNEGVCNILFNETSPLTYPDTFLAWSDCTTDFILKRDITTISNNSLQSLGAGIYNFTLERNNTEDYINIYDEELFTINKASSITTITTTPSSPITYNEASNFSCSNDKELAVTLYIDGIDKTSENNLEIIRGASPSGYNVSCFAFDTENYTGDNDEINYVINKATPIGIVEGGSYEYPYETSIEGIETNEGDDDVLYKLYRDGIEVSNPDVQTFGVGSYYYIYNSTEGQNYSAVAIISNTSVTITQNNTYVLGITGTTPITYGISTDVAGSDCPLQLTCSLDKTNGIYGVGTETFNYSTSGNENYSANSITKDIVINQNTGVCNVLFNETSPLTYPNTFLAWSDCTSAFTLKRNGTIISNNSLQSLGAGIYNFTLTRNDTQNYSNIYDEELFTINQSSRTCILETDKTWTREYDGDYSVTTCNVSEGNDDGTMNFTKNLIAVSSPDFQTNAGEFNYSCEWTGGQNYSDCQETNTLIISNATGVVFAYINNSRANFNADNNTKNTPLNATLQIGTGTIEMYLDGILINSGVSPLSNITDLPIGYYNLTTMYGGNENYTGDIETWWINITEYIIPMEVEFQPNFPNEFAPPTERVIYDIMRTTGAGITLFIGFISHSLPVLLILLMIIGVIIAIGYAVAKIIKGRR
jgi:hypothetical protein